MRFTDIFADDSSSHNSSKHGAPSPPKGSSPGSCKSRIHPPPLPPVRLRFRSEPHKNHSSRRSAENSFFTRRSLWRIAALPLSGYVIAQDLNALLIVQLQLFGLLSLLSWGECMHCGAAVRSPAWRVVVLGGTLVLWGALEVALVLALCVRVLCSPTHPSFPSDLVYGEEKRGTPAGKAGRRAILFASSARV
jgi:hypothetical protein